MAVTPSLWLLSNQTFYQNVFRIEFGTKKDIIKKVRKVIFSILFEFVKVCKNFEMAVTPSLWLLSNQRFYQNVFRIQFGTKKYSMEKSEK
jgi:hypothetical protein